MTEDLGARVAAIKQRAEDARQRRGKAEAQAAVARERAQQAEAALREEFGISPAEAPAFIAAREDDLAAEARRVEELLEKAENSE
jgi:hypothetical protein